jgi:hypothetical protein
LIGFSEVIIAFALMMDAVRTSESKVNFYETTQRNIPEDSIFRIEVF